MAMKLSTTAADAMLTALTGLCNSGSVRIYSGTEPATANTALSGNTLLAELTLNATAFGAPAASGADRVATANAITADTSADASGTATFFRIMQSNGTTVVYQGTAGTSGQQLNLNATDIIAGGNVSISSLTITQPTA
jgi:hypothetical protein